MNERAFGFSSFKSLSKIFRRQKSIFYLEGNVTNFFGGCKRKSMVSQWWQVALIYSILILFSFQNFTMIIKIGWKLFELDEFTIYKVNKRNIFKKIALYIKELIKSILWDFGFWNEAFQKAISLKKKNHKTIKNIRLLI